MLILRTIRPDQGVGISGEGGGGVNGWGGFMAKATLNLNDFYRYLFELILLFY